MANGRMRVPGLFRSSSVNEKARGLALAEKSVRTLVVLFGEENMAQDKCLVRRLRPRLKLTSLQCRILVSKALWLVLMMKPFVFVEKLVTARRESKESGKIWSIYLKKVGKARKVRKVGKIPGALASQPAQAVSRYFRNPFHSMNWNCAG